MTRTEVKTLEQLIEMLASGREDEHLEFKEAKNTFSAQKLIEYCAALANERGGQIVFGVTDRRPRQVVGTRAFENLEVVKRQVFDTLHFRIETTELLHPSGRVLIITIPSRPPRTPVHVSGRYLARVGESLVPMTADQLQRIFSEGISTLSPHSTNGGFLCGKRVRRLREEVGLKPSHLVDLIGFPSEVTWTLAESDRAEIGGEHLASFANLVGARLDWLKHGDGMVYDVVTANDYSWKEDLAALKDIDPFDARVAIDPRRMRCAVLHRESDYRTRTYFFTFDLAFWDWADEHGHIPGIWRCLLWLRNEREIRGGVILEVASADAVFSGEMHAGKLFEAPRSHWFDDLFDLDHENSHLLKEYGAYGKWFLRLQDAVKRWGSANVQKH